MKNLIKKSYLRIMRGGLLSLFITSTKNKPSHYSFKKSCLEKMKFRNNLLSFVTIPKEQKKKVSNTLKVIGIVSLLIGVVPNGLGFILIPFGLGCFGLSVKDLKDYKRVTTYKLKNDVTTRELKNKLLLWKIKK